MYILKFSAYYLNCLSKIYFVYITEFGFSFSSFLLVFSSEMSESLQFMLLN